jgi:hypothetical protein
MKKKTEYPADHDLVLAIYADDKRGLLGQVLM